MATKGNDTPGPNGSPAASPASGGGMKALMPLLANLILMPAIAYGLTTFVLVPKLRSSLAPDGGQAGEHEAAETGDKHSGGDKHSAGEKKGAAEPEKKGHGESGGKAESGAKTGDKGKVLVPLPNKILVNVAGTSGARFLVSSMTIVGKNPNLKAQLEKNDAELRDVASSVLSSKTINDLEKAGARNLVRSELISVFNNVLGQGTVTDIYLTDFAIQ